MRFLKIEKQFFFVKNYVYTVTTFILLINNPVLISQF